MLATVESAFKDLGTGKLVVTDTFVLSFLWHASPQKGEEGV